ncbi:MAG TPA: DUF29 domain-containing protein [Candidatus Binataceae bacterium]|nr:DUF29 domain-containing protein [Candidatus Binataceae bacterium]
MTTVFFSVEDDFYGWLIDQAAALKGQDYNSLDWRYLSEELQAAARTLEQELENDIEVLLTYLLKWRYQPQQRCTASQAVIQNARSSIADRIHNSPRLVRRLKERTNRAYRKACRSAGAAMGLSEPQWKEKFPASCPWDPNTFARPGFLARSRKQQRSIDC